jgi:hypothetical protein
MCAIQDSDAVYFAQVVGHFPSKHGCEDYGVLSGMLALEKTFTDARLQCTANTIRGLRCKLPVKAESLCLVHFKPGPPPGSWSRLGNLRAPLMTAIEITAALEKLVHFCSNLYLRGALKNRRGYISLLTVTKRSSQRPRTMTALDAWFQSLSPAEREIVEHHIETADMQASQTLGA